MIEELIRSAAQQYYAAVTKEKFAADLRDAGFTVYEVESCTQTQFTGSYLSSGVRLNLNQAEPYTVPIKHTEKIRLSEWTYRITGSFAEMGEFDLNEDAA